MVREYIRYLKMVVPEQQNSADGDTVELPIGIDETVRLPVSEILYVDSVKTVAHSICCHLTGQGGDCAGDDRTRPGTAGRSGYPLPLLCFSKGHCRRWAVQRLR